MVLIAFDEPVGVDAEATGGSGNVPELAEGIRSRGSPLSIGPLAADAPGAWKAGDPLPLGLYETGDSEMP